MYVSTCPILILASLITEPKFIVIFMGVKASYGMGWVKISSVMGLPNAKAP
jgi:hypothetical protein